MELVHSSIYAAKQFLGFRPQLINVCENDLDLKTIFHKTYLNILYTTVSLGLASSSLAIINMNPNLSYVKANDWP